MARNLKMTNRDCIIETRDCSTGPFALVSIFSWPFIFPERLQDWMER
jgi:hypothetical protein